MAYSSNLKIWDLNNTNIASSSSADGKSFAVGAPIISTDFNGILKDVSLVTACLVKALINTATTPGDTFVFDNILTSESDIVDAFEYLLTYKDQVNISDLGVNGITTQTIVTTSSTSPSQGTSASNKNGAIKLSNGGIYAKKSIRTDDILFVDEIKATTSGKAPTVYTGIHFVNGSDEVILSPESGATQAILYLPDKQGETLATTTDITANITAALNPISSTVNTLAARSLYEHNIIIALTPNTVHPTTEFIRVSFKLLNNVSTAYSSISDVNNILPNENNKYISASGMYASHTNIQSYDNIIGIKKGINAPEVWYVYYNQDNEWGTYNHELDSSSDSKITVFDYVVTIYTAIS